MVTGQRAFTGSSQASLIAAIMGAEPRSVSATVPVAPRALDHLVARCLAKAPDDRWQTARDVHQELQWVLELPSMDPATTSSSSIAGSGRSWRAMLPAAAGALAMGVAVTALVLRPESEASAPRDVTRLEVSTPARPLVPGLPQLAIAQDGRTIAIGGAIPNGASGIFVRPLSAESATHIAGTESGSGSFAPAFSPDGTWVAFRTFQELLKVPVGGGRPTSLVRFGGQVTIERLAWSNDGWIYYTDSSGQTASSLFRIRAEGGQPEVVTTTTGSIVQSPLAVGDGRFVIFVDNVRNRTAGNSPISVLDTQTRQTRVLLETGGASLAVTATGHLLFVRDGSLFAVPFDLNRQGVSGAPREVLAGIQYDPSNGVAQYAVSSNGTLVYRSGAAPGTTLMWADARGALRAFPEERIYYDPRLSPDGRFVAAEVLGDSDDIWVLDLTRGTQTKLSLGSEEDETPAWSPDGRWVAWSTNRDAKRVIVRKRADGSGQEEVLWSGPEHAHVTGFAPGGQSLLFEKQTVERNTDIWLLPLDGSGKERLILGTAFNEVGARLSPDGRWLAYMSDETGIPQIYVQPFPALDARFLISKSGGQEPVWSRDGRRLLYRADGVMWSVSIAPGEAFKPGIAERVFDGRYENKAVTHTGYDVAPDGRFLVIGNSSSQAEALMVILNWTEELKRLVPTK